MPLNTVNMHMYYCDICILIVIIWKSVFLWDGDNLFYFVLDFSFFLAYSKNFSLF